MARTNSSDIAENLSLYCCCCSSMIFIRSSSSEAGGFGLAASTEMWAESGEDVEGVVAFGESSPITAAR